MKKILKKNQIIIYVIALMLVTAGYLNFTTNTKEQASVETSLQMESNDDTQVADIGDVTLASSNDVVMQDANTENVQDVNSVNNTSNTGDVNNTVNPDGNSVVDASSAAQSDSGDYFVKSKLERETMYSQMLESYENVLNSSNALETQKQSATEEIKKINDIKNSIMVCENLITTKGFDKNVVFVNGESVSVIVGASGELQQDQVAQIQNIVSREIGVQIENIHISQK